MCSHKQHKSQQMYKNPAPRSQVNVCQQEDPFTTGEEGMQGSCQAPFGLLGCTGCHCQALPAEQTCGKAGLKAAHALQLQTSPLRWSCGPHTEHCLKKFPRAKSKKKGMFVLNSPHPVHCAEAAWYAYSMKPPPTT